MTRRSLTLLASLCTALTAACAGDNAVGPTSLGPSSAAPEPVLARLEVTPDSSLLTLGEDQRVTINAWDQFGERLLPATGDNWAPYATYVISDSAVALVGGGMLNGLAPGVARITASLTINDRTRTDSMTVTVVMPTATSAVITLDQYGYGSPYIVSLKAPAAVTWVIPDGVQAPGIWLTIPGANPEMLAFVNGVATRTLSTPGYYWYGTADMREWNDTGGVVRVF